jgi:hypothetical protein
VKTTIGGIEYDSEASKKLAHKATSSIDEQLHITTDGNYFLLILQVMVDGKPLGPYESWMDLRQGGKGANRLSVGERILALTHRQTIEWCIKTQIPSTLRGFFLESI